MTGRLIAYVLVQLGLLACWAYGLSCGHPGWALAPLVVFAFRWPPKPASEPGQ